MKNKTFVIILLVLNLLLIFTFANALPQLEGCCEERIYKNYYMGGLNDVCEGENVIYRAFSTSYSSCPTPYTNACLYSFSFNKIPNPSGTACIDSGASIGCTQSSDCGNLNSCSSNSAILTKTGVCSNNKCDWSATTTTQCSSPTPYCNNGVCRSCSQTSHCAVGSICNLNTFTCCNTKTGCTGLSASLKIYNIPPPTPYEGVVLD